MATKRAKRIDPNAAFAAIVGATPAEAVPQAAETTTAAPAPGRVGEGAPPATAAQGAQGTPAPLPDGARETPALAAPAAALFPGGEVLDPTAGTGGFPAAATQYAANLAHEGAQALQAAQPDPLIQNAPQVQPGPSDAISAGAASFSQPAPAAAAAQPAYTPQTSQPGPAPQDKPATLPLVQKGYYITEEQHRRLGMAAVLQGSDRSAIVRAALEMYFTANKDVLP